jgi:hypothetical protein
MFILNAYNHEIEPTNNILKNIEEQVIFLTSLTSAEMAFQLGNISLCVNYIRFKRQYLITY